MSIAFLIQKQNPDGGWPYVRGVSWTEPTAYAVMALLTVGESGAAERGLRWLRATQRSDGGWAPHGAVDRSTWVTALAALAPLERLGEKAHARAISWLLKTTGEESSSIYRLRQWLLGNAAGRETPPPGWPWFPGNAAWVGPTALAVIALEKEGRRRSSAAVADRVECGRQFLLARACADGGWNHGSARDLEDSRPYPETTGLALAALRGVISPKVERAIQVATGFLEQCRSADELNWLRLGLMAQDCLPAGYCPPERVARRTLPEASLDLLASAAAGRGSSFWC
jgi:hypothetical protein